MRSNMNIRTLLRVASAAIFFAFGSLAQAQTGTVTQYAFPIGKGPGVTGFDSVLCTQAQTRDWAKRGQANLSALSGDVTMTAGGVTAIGASKVQNAELATMAANTTKCNATAGTTNPTDCTAATMRTNLALVPGTNVEAWDADLDALAALAGTGIARRTASNTWSVGTAVSNAELATMTTNTVKGNATSGTAVPTDLAVPSCSTATSALTWTTNTGFGCNSISGGAASVLTPGGRLTPSSGVCAPVTDSVAATAIYYAPCGGEYVPTYDGTSIQGRKFTSGPTDAIGLTLTLGSNWAANTLYDVFFTMNAGSPVLCTVAWTSSVAGSSSRATALSQYGVLTNGAAIAACRTTNAATIAVAINQGTWVGTFLTASAAGTVDLKFGTAAAGGGPACACIYNAYNQVVGAFNAQDSNASWATVATSGFEAMNPQASSGVGNRIQVVAGTSSNSIDVNIGVAVTLPASTNGYLVGALNGTSTPWSKCTFGLGSAGTVTSTVIPLVSICKGPVLTGLNFIQALQASGSTSTSWIGNQSGLQIEGFAAAWMW
jgi:hypothetical protein